MKKIEDIKKIIGLFSKNPTEIKGRWGQEAPESLIILTNLIDMVYNYTSNQTYHNKHFNEIKDVNQNTPGFVATHLFAEYLMKNKNITYKKALQQIESKTSSLTDDDWYIGLILANATWRQSAIYRDRCSEGYWLISFNSIYKESGLTLLKDKIQLKMCAYLMLMYLNNDKDLFLPELKHDDKELIKDISFPTKIRTYVIYLKKLIDPPIVKKTKKNNF